jgi:hypothetical protein
MKRTRLAGWAKDLLWILAVAFPVSLGMAGQTNTPPRLGPPALLNNGVIRFLIYNGTSGQTNIVETSADMVVWTPISTNVFPPTLCPTCPFIVFQDSVTNSTRRFYRARNLN